MNRRASILLPFLLLLAGCEGARDVETLRPRRGLIRESFSEPAKTRLEKTFQVTLPVAGRIGRIDLEPGDKLTKGQPLAEYDLAPLRYAVEKARAAVAELEAGIIVKEDNRLEETALVHAEAAVEAASEALKASEAQVEAERARAERAAKELVRMRRLAAEQAVTQQKLEDVELDAETSLIELRRQEFYRAALAAMNTAIRLGPQFVRQYIARKSLEREVMVHQLAQARSVLAQAEHDLELASLLSPIHGVVLEKYEQGDATLPAGRDLLLLGDLSELQAEADVLTQDALRLAPGSAVILEPAARRTPLDGKVLRIEPAGFTKLSSLGVEQQRVKVIVGLETADSDLGVGFRLQARFITGSREDALIVPRYSVLQAPDGAFYVLKVTYGKITKQPVEIGLRSDLDLEILAGLSESDDMVAHADTTLDEGSRVRVTRAAGPQ